MAGTLISTAQVVYIDSASPLGRLPPLLMNTAINVGDKFCDMNQDSVGSQTIWQAGSLYFECTTAGTTFAYKMSAPLEPGLLWQVGATAVVRVRAYHGWDRAFAGKTTGNWDSMRVYGKRCMIASSATITALSTYDPPVYGVTGVFNEALEPYGSLVSVSKVASNVVSTFTPGAVISRCTQATTYGLGTARFVRGVTIHGNTGGTYQHHATARGAHYGVYYDCTFEASTTYADVTGSKCAASDPANQSVRCTYRQLSSAAATGGMFGWDGLNNTGNYVVAPTVSCAGTISSIAGMVNAQGTNATISVLGGDFSGISSGVSSNPRNGYPSYGALVRFWGAKFASGRLNTSRDDGASILNSTDGTTVVSAFGSSYNGNTSTELREAAVYRSGGAQDPNGAYSYSLLADYTATRTVAMAYFNPKVDEGYDITVELLAELSGTGLTKLSVEDIWMEITYPDQPSTWHGGFSSTRNKDNWQGFIHTHVTGPLELESSTATWVSQPAGSVKYKLKATINPRRAGMVRVVVYVRPCPWTAHRMTATTVKLYFDPIVTLSAAS